MTGTNSLSHTEQMMIAATSVRRTIAIAIAILGLSACSAKSESASDSTAAVEGESETLTSEATEAAPTAAIPAVPTVGVDQMPATAQVSVTGPQGNHQWNGSWNITSNRLGCGVLTYPRMLNVNIADEDNTRGDFQELDVGTSEAPEVGGSTNKFSVSLGLDRPGPNLSITPGTDADDSGTLTIVSSANGNSRVTFNARDNRGIQITGEFTCVPRADQ